MGRVPAAGLGQRRGWRLDPGPLHLCIQESTFSHSPQRGHSCGVGHGWGQLHAQSQNAAALHLKLLFFPPLLPSSSFSWFSQLLENFKEPLSLLAWQTADGSRATNHSFSQSELVQVENAGDTSFQHSVFLSHSNTTSSLDKK